MKKKAAQRGAVVPVASDLAVFKLLYDYRLLRREHLSALTGRHPTRLHRRLHRLVHSHYIKRLRPLAQQKHIYALGTKAGPLLVEHGAADPALLDERSRVHELREFFLKHEMMIVDLHVILELATRGGPLRLVAWKEGRGLFDTVTVSDHQGSKSLPIRPDAFFTLEDSRRPVGANRVHFFLEADRSSATQPRLRDKFRAYWHYLDGRLHEKKFGIKNFRVLTVTVTDSRAKNLCAFVRSLVPERAHKYYLFTAREPFTLGAPSSILDNVLLSPRSAEVRFSLVRPLRDGEVI